MNKNKSVGIWDRMIQNLRSAWGRVASFGEQFSETTISASLDDEDRVHVIEQMQACLEARGGEVSARIRAAQLGRVYVTLDEIGRRRFLHILAEEFDVDHEAVAAKALAISKALEPNVRFRAEADLRAALAAPRVKLLTQFNGLPEGVKFLVDMRAEILELKKTDTLLFGLEVDLKELLTSWFDVGFLELRQIDWRTPASLLEKLFAYEAVHEIQGWDDLKNRLASDRRCFAFFHPKMPDEPLIFVWVALVKGMAVNVQELLDESAPEFDAGTADTAIFYSISNAQAGLSGINFGNFLIKRVLDSLSLEFKGLRQFATLSPIPGMMAWLLPTIDRPDCPFLKADDADDLKQLAQK
ncbi:MAG: malonyl-CoA decarboxylase family protein, partial [Pseudomonadota bacterium]|nr:malonyl-CoA decarboxylase family protein [Pseudomonadota bacterium]